MKFKAKVILPVIAVLLLVGVGTYLYMNKPEEEEPVGDGRIPYAEGVVLMEGTEIEPVPRGRIALRYNYQAHSTDGINFTCKLGNDESNQYDLYFDLYADAELTDQIYLSGLLRPGTALDNITLNHALPEGTNTVYVSFNQVSVDEEGNQSLLSQTLVTVDFIVSG